MSRQHPPVASCPGPAWWRNATDASTNPGLLLPASAGSTPLWTAAGRGVGVHHCLSQRDKIARREREGEREGEGVVRMEGREKERESPRQRNRIRAKMQLLFWLLVEPQIK